MRIIKLSVDILTDEYQKRSLALQDKLRRLTSDELWPALDRLSEREQTALFAAYAKVFTKRLKTEIVEFESDGNVSWANGVQLIAGRRGIQKAIVQLKPYFAEGKIQWVEFEALYSEGFPPTHIFIWTLLFEQRTYANKINRLPSRQSVSQDEKRLSKKS
jgi:hypothetical protein